MKVKKSKSVAFADGVVPGEGSSASEGEDEEIHSPPPPNQVIDKEQAEANKLAAKKLKKKMRVRVRAIKQVRFQKKRLMKDFFNLVFAQFSVNVDPIESPPPPPEAPVNGNVLKLYPGCTHYTYTGTGTFLVFAQQKSEEELQNGSANQFGKIGSLYDLLPTENFFFLFSEWFFRASPYPSGNVSPCVFDGASFAIYGCSSSDSDSRDNAYYRQYVSGHISVGALPRVPSFCIPFHQSVTPRTKRSRRYRIAFVGG